MRAIELALVSFFEQAANKDSELLKAIQQTPVFQVNTTHWYFTLPDLYNFLQQHDDTFSLINYSQFRKLLFDSTINQDIKPYGAEI